MLFIFRFHLYTQSILNTDPLRRPTTEAIINFLSVEADGGGDKCRLDLERDAVDGTLMLFRYVSVKTLENLLEERIEEMDEDKQYWQKTLETAADDLALERQHFTVFPTQ